jgi:alkylhydroperoxidase family enzyme
MSAAKAMQELEKRQDCGCKDTIILDTCFMAQRVDLWTSAQFPQLRHSLPITLAARIRLRITHQNSSHHCVTLHRYSLLSGIMFGRE